MSDTESLSICTTEEIDHRVRATSEKVDDTISTFQDRILAACNAQLAETEKLERELMSSVKKLQVLPLRKIPLSPQKEDSLGNV